MKISSGFALIAGITAIVVNSIACSGMEEQYQSGQYQEDNVSIEPDQIYAEAFDKLSSLDSYAAVVNIDISREEDRNYALGMNIKLQNRNSDPEYMMDRDTAFNGEFSEHSETFYTDDFYHSTVYRYDRPDEYTKFKNLMESDEAVRIFTSPIDALVLEPAYLTDVQLDIISESKQLLTFQVKPEAFTSIGVMISDSSIAYHAAVQELRIKELSGVAEIDADGYMTKSEIRMNVYQADVLCDMNLQVEFINPGQDCSFSFPSTIEYVEFIDMEETISDNINYAAQQAKSELKEPANSRQIYADAVGKTSNLESYAAAVRVRNQSWSGSGGGTATFRDEEIEVKMQNKNSSDAKCLLKIAVDESRFDSTYDTIFYIAGQVYQHYTGGERELSYELMMPLEDVMDEYVDPLAGVVWNPNYLTDISVIDEADGNQKITFNVTTEGARVMVQQVTRLILRVDYMNVPEGEISGTVIVDSDGYMTESEIFIEERNVGTWYIRTEFDNPGQPVDLNHLTVENFDQ